MTMNQIKIKYDQFFGDGLWERNYKPHITVFAEQCVRESDSKEIVWMDCKTALPRIGDKVLVERITDNCIYYAIYSDDQEFDLHIPSSNPEEKDQHRQGNWYKFSPASILQWKLIQY